MNDLNSTEDFSPEEMAYITSKGEDTSALQAPEQSAPQSTPEPVATAQPEAHGDDDAEITIEIGADGKPRDLKSGRFVPHGAFHKERERRKALESENLSYREKMARADERLAVLNQIIGAQEGPEQAQKEEPINPDEDIFGAFKQAMGKIEKLQSQLNVREQREQSSAAEQNLVQSYQNDAVRFLQEKPDFKDAYFHLVNARHKELEAIGVTDHSQRNAMIAQEEKGLVAQAIQNRRSPAQVMYQLALARGFTAGQSPAPTPSPTPTPNPTPSPAAQKIEQIKAGQQKTASLSSAGGSPGEGMTLEALANMSDDEFHKKVGHLSRNQLRKLMGE